MTNMLRTLIGAALLLSATACDSMPGAMDPEPEGKATLIVRNVGSRIATSVELRSCDTNSVVHWARTSIGPNQTWQRGFNAGCHRVLVEFNTGGGWTASVQLSETQPQTIQPW